MKVTSDYIFMQTKALPVAYKRTRTPMMRCPPRWWTRKPSRSPFSTIQFLLKHCESSKRKCHCLISPKWRESPLVLPEKKAPAGNRGQAANERNDVMQGPPLAIPRCAPVPRCRWRPVPPTPGPRRAQAGQCPRPIRTNCRSTLSISRRRTIRRG